jgi:hypothetical protein
MFHFLFTLLLLAFISAFQNTKRPKIFLLFSLFVSLALYLWFASLAIFGFVFEKSKNILLCLHFPFVLISKSKTQKYLLFFFGFVKFVAEFSLL